MSEHKCKICNELKLDSEFHKRPKTLKDGTVVIRIGQYKCKQCLASLKAPYKRLSPEEFKASYASRAKSISEGVKASKAKRSVPVLIDKGLRAVNVMTGEVRLFKSALDAAKSGEFNNTSISRAMTEKRPYNDYFWSYSES